jgi:putative iron-dependent peroxidase
LSTPEPQAVLSPLTEAAIFLVLTVRPGGEEVLRDLLADVSGLRRSVGFRIPEGELTCVTGIGSELWDRMFGDKRPAELHPFKEIRGDRHTAVATAGDLLFHIRAHRLDMCFELAGLLVGRLSDVAKVVDEVHGFRSFDERDLLGFVDGTENPAGVAAFDSVHIGEEDEAHEAGSYTIIQKYLHDLPAWNGLPVEHQERAVGRTKLEDIELADDVKPSNSHVALNTIEDGDGNQRQIVRHNMPFGHVGAAEFGTYFIGYARTPAVIEEMLRNMFVGKPPGNHDRLLDFSTAITGTLFFIPSADFLDDPPAGPTQTAADEPEPASSGAIPQGSDTSLGIGSLRGA